MSKDVTECSASNMNPGVKQPDPLKVEIGAEMHLTWKHWENLFSWYSKAIQLNKSPKEVQAAVLMTVIGPDVTDIFESFNLSESEKGDMNVILKKFREYFSPKCNEIYESYQFFLMRQSPDEKFHDFLVRVRVQIKKCNYAAGVVDRLIRDKIVSGLSSERLKEKLLAADNPSLNETIKVCQAYEQASRQMKKMNSEKTENEIAAVEKSGDSKSAKSKTKSKTQDVFDCSRCLTKHGPRKCPAFNKKCPNCGYRGHVKEACRSRRKVQKVSQEDEEDEDESSDEAEVEELKIFSVTGKHSSDWTEELQYQNKKFTVKIDTGAECCVLPMKILKRLGVEKVAKTGVKRLISYDGGSIDVVGKVRLQCLVRGKPIKVVFQVINKDCTPVIDGDTSTRAKIIQRVSSVKEDIFQGLGCVKDFVYDVDLCDNPKWQIHKPRTIPHSARDDVKAEIDKMVHMKVIQPCTEPREMVSPLVIVRKNGKYRVCIDLTDVNKNIKRRHFPLRTLDEIVARISGSKRFTKLDCTKGFWQLKVSEKTSKILTFTTPWGRYECLRLPFGLASAPEIYQQIMEGMLGHLEGVEVSMDDVLIHAETPEKLAEITEKVVQILSNNGLKLNKEKCAFNQSKIKFLGHVFTEKGLEVDPEKVEAIKNLRMPNDKEALQRLLGAVTYLGKFVPNLSQITSPLRELLKKGTAWHWEIQHEQAYHKIIDALVNAPVLQFYDVKEDVTLSVDSSSKAFGGVLMQNGHPVAYASKSLSSSEQNWPQIEKEAGAIRYACAKFHDMIWGKKIVIETDHKPLESIFKKTLTQAPPRLRRILFDVKPYNPTIVYKRGKDIPLADALSRDSEGSGDCDSEEQCEVLLTLCLHERAKERFTEATDADKEMQTLKKFILKGWPESQKEVPVIIRPYFTHRDEISMAEGLIFKGDRCVVPASERKNVLKSIHNGHWGIQSCLRRAREFVYWPKMNEEICEMVNKCSVCEKHQNLPPREELKMKEVPKAPFQIVSTDLFSLNGDEYVLLADSFSGYFDFKKLRSTSSEAVITFLKEKFSDWGIPEQVHSDGGPQYTSREFKQFSADWGFEHIISSPYFPRSNGLAERYVQTAKKMIKKCIADKQDIRLALLMSRITPGNGLKSVGERICGRKLRNPLSFERFSSPEMEQQSEVLLKARENQKRNSDKGVIAREHKPLSVGDRVRVKESSGNWQFGRVKEKCTERSYLVELDDGKTIRRNSKFIHPTKVDASIDTTPDNSCLIDVNPDPVTPEQVTVSPQHQTPPPGTPRSRFGRPIRRPVRLDL